jgi:hypothetical protein
VSSCPWVQTPHLKLYKGHGDKAPCILDLDKWSISHSGCFILRGKAPCTYWIKFEYSPRAGLDNRAKGKNPAPAGTQTLAIQPVSSNFTKLSHLTVSMCRLIKIHNTFQFCCSVTFRFMYLGLQPSCNNQSVNLKYHVKRYVSFFEMIKPRARWMASP